jgi:hypothetical protein
MVSPPGGPEDLGVPKPSQSKDPWLFSSIAPFNIPRLQHIPTSVLKCSSSLFFKKTRTDYLHALAGPRLIFVRSGRGHAEMICQGTVYTSSANRQRAHPSHYDVCRAVCRCERCVGVTLFTRNMRSRYGHLPPPRRPRRTYTQAAEATVPPSLGGRASAPLPSPPPLRPRSRLGAESAHLVGSERGGGACEEDASEQRWSGGALAASGGEAGCPCLLRQRQEDG